MKVYYVAMVPTRIPVAPGAVGSLPIYETKEAALRFHPGADITRIRIATKPEGLS